MVLKGAEIIIVPAAFPSGQPLPPRTDHWDVLVRSTALLNLVYVVATNQFGYHQGQNYFGLRLPPSSIRGERELSRRVVARKLSTEPSI